MLTRILREIFKTNLGVKPHEKVLIFTDKPGPNVHMDDTERERRNRLRDIALLTVASGRPFVKEIDLLVYPARKKHGEEPPEHLWKRAFGEKTVEALKGKRLMTSLLRKTASHGQIKDAEALVKKYCSKAPDVVIALVIIQQAIPFSGTFSRGSAGPGTLACRFLVWTFWKGLWMWTGKYWPEGPVR